MELQIVSPKQHRVLNVLWVDLNTPLGNMIIQELHQPMVLSLVPGKPFTFAVDNTTVEAIAIKIGIVEITRNRVTLILNEE
jgi:F0F1-type ATP synthase epsilon subunit